MTGHTPIKIPAELLEQVERGNVLLFVGERLSRDPAGEVLLDRLAAELAERAGIADADFLTFPEIAQAYEDERGRQALVEFVCTRIDALGDRPQLVHRLIAGLTQCNVLVTTTLSGRLEQAFREAGRRLQVVIRNEDIAFEDEQVTRLYKLRGSLDRPESLVLTEDDNEQFFEAQDSVSVVLQGYLARKTILFIGYDLEDLHFKRLYSRITLALDPFPRRSFAFGETPPSKVARWCKRKGIDVIEANTADFLQALTNQLAARASPPSAASAPTQPPGAPLPKQPYKLLDYYEADDAAIYFGRERETLELSSLIHAHRLTLLYGASGVGKTSLLLAGAAPRLAQQDQPYETIYARALEDPALAIRRAVLQRLPEAPLPREGPLVDFLAAATRALGRPIVLVLDQFEEFFIRLSPQFRAAFTAELGAICEVRDVPVKVVLSLREDWLASVNELEQRIPEVFRNRMRVLPLTREQARQAIIAPIERLGLSYEGTLVEQLLDDLASSVSAEIMPPQLQLVCSALYRRLPSGERLITLTSYEQIEGARGVLQQYLDDELARLGRDERILARSVLAELVTSQGTKAVRTADELALALDVAPDRLASVLEMLVRARLLRVLEREDGALSYELSHEYLIGEIELEADAKARKQAEELIRQEVDNWRRFGTLLAADKLALIDDARAVLRLGQEAQELLLRSVLEVGADVDYWLGRMDDPAQRARVLADKARTRVPAVRIRTAHVLGTQDVPESIEPLLELALFDPDDGVREAAQSSLARLDAQRPLVVERLQMAVRSNERQQRAAALRTLARLPLHELPAELRRPVLAARLRLRTAKLAQASVATPLRRASLLTAGFLLAIVLLLALVSANVYYIDARPVLIQGQQDTVIVRRGLPILPVFSRIEVDTGVDVSQLRRDAVNESRLWGLWMLRGKRDYDQWGKDLAVTLPVEQGAPMLWYLNHDEGIKWLQEAVSPSSVSSSRSWSIQALGELLSLQREPVNSAAFETLRPLLKDDNLDVRYNAISAFGLAAINPQVNGAEVVSALLPLLKDDDPSVRYIAASTLGQMMSMLQLNVAEIASALLPLLKDDNPGVRGSVVDALHQAATTSQVNGTEVISALLPLLKDDDPGVRINAVDILGQVAITPQVDVVQLISALLPLLKDDDPGVRRSATSVLGQAAITPQAEAVQLISALLPLLKDDDPDMRINAANALGQAAINPQLNVAEIASDLLPLLKDDDPRVRGSAVSALGQVATNPWVNGTEIVSALLPLLKDDNLDVRYNAINTLGQVATNPQVNGAEVVSALLPLLKDDDRRVRIDAASALGQVTTNPQVNGAEIVSVLLPLLKDDDLGVRDSVVNALGPVATNPQVEVAQLVSALLPLLKDDDPNVRYNAVGGLYQVVITTQVEVAQLVSALLPLLKDDDPDVRINTTRALGQAATTPQVNGAEVISALLPLLKDDNPNVRYNAVGALRQAATNLQVNDSEVVSALLPLLKDNFNSVQDITSIALLEVYTEHGRTASDMIRSDIYRSLIDPYDAQIRPIAARSLFLIALRNQDQAQDIRDFLDTDEFARSPRPIARLWSNKVLTMLKIADLTGSTELESAQLKRFFSTLQPQYPSTSFFGEDFSWAASQAIAWLDQQTKDQPEATP